MTDEEFAKRVEAVRAKGVEVERPAREYDGPDGTWGFGDRVRLVADDPGGYAYQGDVGVCCPETVGSPDYGNEHVALYIVIDGQDSAVDVNGEYLEAE